MLKDFKDEDFENKIKKDDVSILILLKIRLDQYIPKNHVMLKAKSLLGILKHYHHLLTIV